MSRRHRAKVRDIIIESKYNNLSLTRFINKVMKSGKKSLARKIVYSALEEAETKANKVVQFFRENGYPLLATFEPEE